MTTYLPREKATAFVREQGVPIGDRQLGELAYRGGGPKFSIINGRALYLAKDLLAWIKAQASRAPQKASKRGRHKSHRGRRETEAA
jgi:hypothetical protein